MNKIETYAVPFTAYEENDPTADHNFIAFWEVEHRNYEWVPQDYAAAKGRGGNYKYIMVPEYVITNITVILNGCISTVWRTNEDVIETIEFDGEITMSQFDATVREMVADSYYVKWREPESWESFYESCEFGQMVNLTNPFGTSNESAA